MIRLPPIPHFPGRITSKESPTAGRGPGRSLRWWTLTLTNAILIAAVTIVGAMEAYMSFRSTDTLWRDRQGEAARSAAATIAGFLDRSESVLATISQVGWDRVAESSDGLQSLLKTDSTLQEIACLDHDGRLIAYAGRAEALLFGDGGAARSAWFLQARDGRPYRGAIHSTPSGQSEMVIARPAPRGGVVAARISTSILFEVLRDTRFGQTGQAYVVNQAGRVLAHSDPRVAIGGPNIADRPEMLEIARFPGNEWQSRYRNFLGIDVVGASSSVANSDWIIVTEVDSSEAFAVFRHGGITLVVILFVLIIATFWFDTRLVDRMVGRPIARFRAGAERIGRGDLHHRIGATEPVTELNELATAFNEMAARLCDHQEQLAAQNSMLAAEVAERTRAEAEKAQALKELREAAEALDQRVCERTASLEQATRDLSQVNAQLLQREASLSEAAHLLRAEIAERTRAEEALQIYAARLEGSNRELQEFAYIASHDLQEPLRKVQAFGDRLRTKYGAVLDEQGLDYVARMQGAAVRMRTLIEGLLTYSRVTTKAQPFSPVDLNAVAREVLDDLETRIEELNAVVTVEKLPVIRADALQMRQLFQNLIGNALKFHCYGQAPDIRVSAERQNGHELPAAGTGRDDAGRDDAGWRVCFTDNGIGFDEKYLDRIFQVFQRLHGRGVYEGAGIGLAVCRKIVERHSGSITARSTPGQGSTFIVVLPTHPSEKEHQPNDPVL